MDRFVFASLLLLAPVFSAFAQQTPEVFLSRASTDPNRPWTQSYTSDRFVIWYNSEQANVTEENARRGLDSLERIFDEFVYNSNFRHPHQGRNANQRFKMEVYIMRDGEGHAFGSVSGNPSVPSLYIAPGILVPNPRYGNNIDYWALAHEFMHGLQIQQGAMGGGNTNNATNYRGWFFETHANLAPHWVYPDEVHYCAELYTRTANRYLGSSRNNYCNWHFFEYLVHRMGGKAVNDMWVTESPRIANHDPFTEIMRRENLTQQQFNDIFGDYATRAVIWDINRHRTDNNSTQSISSVHPNPAYAGRGSARFRNAFNRDLGEMFKRPRYTYLEELPDVPAGNNAAGNRYVVPDVIAPQRYAYNIIRLYPDEAAGTVTVRFRGDVQKQNNIEDYTRRLQREPLPENLPDNPGSDWRYGLVAVTGDANAQSGAVTARYTPIMRASDGNPDVSVTMQSGETQLYLVVAATPTIHHKISVDQFWYTVYRFPYMVEINGAKPEGFQAVSAAGLTQLPASQGGGWVARPNNIDATAWVGPNARVLGNNAQVRGNARIEGRAVVKGSAIVRDRAVVKDYALVAGGTVSDDAVIADGANIYNAQVSGNSRVDGAPNISNSNTRIYGNARVGGVCWIDSRIDISGTAQFLGDGEVHGVTASQGVFYGFIDAGVITDNQNQFGRNRAEPPKEVTAPRSMRWYGDSTVPDEPDDTDNPDDPNSVNTAAAAKRVSSFNMSSRGGFTYNLADGVNGARLKVFDIRGKLINTVPLRGMSGTVNTRASAAQMIFWRVEGADGKIIGKSGSGVIVR